MFRLNVGDLDLNTSTFCWSNPTTVLLWLSDNPSRWKTIVENQTSEILESFDRGYWQHISSADNTADCASIGLVPLELKNFDVR